MPKNPLVSVLMTAFNREKYIAEAIESVIASTYQNWELIIVDDQSKDSTVEIVREYEYKDPRIKVYINEKNLGDYPNRNQAASYAQGKYIKYLDADDVIYPHGLTVMVANMELYPDAGYAIFMIEQWKGRPYPFQLSQSEAYFEHYFNKEILNRSPLSTIIRRSAFENVGKYSGKRMVGDFEMWHKLSAHYPVVLMTGGLAWYRSHNEQQMSDFKSDSVFPFKYFLISLEQLQSNNCPLSPELKKRAINKVKKRMCRYILSSVKKLDYRKAQEMKTLSGWSWTQILNNVIR